MPVSPFSKGRITLGLEWILRLVGPPTLCYLCLFLLGLFKFDTPLGFFGSVLGWFMYAVGAFIALSELSRFNEAKEESRITLWAVIRLLVIFLVMLYWFAIAGGLTEVQPFAYQNG